MNAIAEAYVKLVLARRPARCRLCGRVLRSGGMEDRGGATEKGRSPEIDADAETTDSRCRTRAEERATS